MKKLLILGAFLLTNVLLKAQTTQIIPCYTDEHYEHSLLEYPEKEALRAQTEAIIQESLANHPEGTQSVVHKIPVVVHVIYYDDYQNISDEQVQDAIDVLNEDFRKLNSDASNFRTSIFGNINTDMEIEFELAKIDPDGNCTNGITRTYSEFALAGNGNVKGLVNWDNNKYLNIWTVEFIDRPAPGGGIILGYSSFPYVGQPKSDDGIVMRHDRMGRIGTANAGYGRTLTHEVGHYVNLFHPFQGGCFSGDQVGDTPPVAQANYGCSFSTNSCSNDNPNLPDMIENYMDYTDEVCQNAFTAGQKIRAKAVLNNNQLRGSLTTSANLIATGISGAPANCDPVASFTLDKKYFCAGETVTFENTSDFGGQAGVTYNWQFPGGTPATSTTANPSVTYANPGFHSATLTVTNAQGTNSVTKTNYFQTFIAPPKHILTFVEGFENNAVPGSNWVVQDDDNGITWEVTSNAAYSGSKSVFINNYDVKFNDGESDMLISDPVEIKFAATANLTFKHAFVKKDGSSGDKFEIYVSPDCGQTWELKRLLSSFALTTGANVANTPYIPSSQSDWKSTSIDLTSYVGTTDNIMFMFKFIGDGGNNFYLDDINMNTTIGVQEWNSENGTISLFPNPASDFINLDFDLAEETSFDIYMIDMSGRKLYSSSMTAIRGQSVKQIDISTLVKGVYLFQIQSSKGVRTIRFVKQ